MDNVFILNPSATTSNLKDAICERLMKAKAIAACLLSQDQNHREPNCTSLHGAIWAINDYLDEIEYFEDKIKEREK